MAGFDVQAQLKFNRQTYENRYHHIMKLGYYILE